MNTLHRAPETWLGLLALALLMSCAPGVAATEPAPMQPPTALAHAAATVAAGEPPAEQSDYRTALAEEMPGYAEFLEAYEAAQSEGAKWLGDPVEVALRAAGYAPGRLPDQVTLYQTAPGHTSVVLLLEGAEDDSLRDVEHRIDLAAADNLWRVEWAGARWRCQAGRGQQDWGTELCI